MASLKSTQLRPHLVIARERSDRGNLLNQRLRVSKVESTCPQRYSLTTTGHYHHPMPKTYYAYILTNKRHSTLYTGVTGDLPTRIYRHKNGTGSKFTSKYKTTILVYAKAFKYVNDAIAYEKYLKDGPRKRKIKLIEENNPNWDDLYETVR